VQKELVDRAWDRSQPLSETLVEAFRAEIKRKDLLTLRGLEWLNDEIVNYYMEMIADRPKRPCAQRIQPLPKVVFGAC